MVALEGRFATRPCQHWLDLLRDHGVPCAPVNTSEAATADPQVDANDYLTPVDQPDVGRVRAYGTPVRFSAAENPVLGPAPAAGGDTAAICAEIGLGAAEIDDLRAAGVVT